MAAKARSTDKQFERSISQGVTLVDFDAPWCRPCRAQKPIIAALKKRYQGSAVVREINIDENPGIAMRLGIQSIPTIIVFKDGGEMSRFIGLQSAETLDLALANLIDRSQ